MRDDEEPDLVASNPRPWRAPSSIAEQDPRISVNCPDSLILLPQDEPPPHQRLDARLARWRCTTVDAWCQLASVLGDPIGRLVMESGHHAGSSWRGPTNEAGLGQLPVGDCSSGVRARVSVAVAVPARARAPGAVLRWIGRTSTVPASIVPASISVVNGSAHQKGPDRQAEPGSRFQERSVVCGFRLSTPELVAVRCVYRGWGLHKWLGSSPWGMIVFPSSALLLQTRREPPACDDSGR